MSHNNNKIKNLTPVKVYRIPNEKPVGYSRDEADSMYDNLYEGSNVDRILFKKFAEYATLQREADKINEIKYLQNGNYLKRFETFLKTKYPSTARNYKICSNRWIDFISNVKGLKVQDYFLVDVNDVIGFNTYLLEYKKLSINSVRCTIDCMKSFYGFVEKTTNGKIKNIFKFAVKPKQENSVVNIPTNKEIKIITNAIKDKNLLVAVKMICKYGYRIGFFEHLTLLENNKIRFYSKGKWFVRKIDRTDLRMLVGIGYKIGVECNTGGQSVNTLSHKFRRLCVELNKKGSINHCYHIHELRHKFAVDTYKDTLDIHYVSHCLGHSSIAITEIYLRGLNVDI
jgi:site-specific recombinase XerD